MDRGDARHSSGNVIATVQATASISDVYTSASGTTTLTSSTTLTATKLEVPATPAFDLWDIPQGPADRTVATITVPTDYTYVLDSSASGPFEIVSTGANVAQVRIKDQSQAYFTNALGITDTAIGTRTQSIAVELASADNQTHTAWTSARWK